jgi:CRISPR-associated protein Cas2
MAVNQPRRWLIAYDIRDRRRLGRVHRFLMQQAIPVQYSVFAARGSLSDMRRMAEELRMRIDERADDVRIYPIPENPLVHTIGATLLPDDVWLLDAKTGLGAVLAPPSRPVRGVESTPVGA